ncbi:hypothetical protein [Chryseobacterium hagamense]|nr:hypothetical protein [Chryseobacterium hagamense]
MIKIFLNILNQNKYSLELPVYRKYSAMVYQKIIEERFSEFKDDLPDTFEDFVEKLKNYCNQDFHGDRSISFDEFESNNLSCIVEKSEDIMRFVSSNKEILSLSFGFTILFYTHIFTIISIKKRTLVHSKDELLKFFDKKVQFSQTAIAKEWDINNDTLSKWFEIMYQTNPFANRKKINLSEYLRIYNDFFILEKDKRHNDNDFMIPEDKIDFYVFAAVKGKTYKKSEIIELGFDLDEKATTKHYTQARKFLLEKFPYYTLIDKFPNSWALELINELKTK